MILVDQQTGEWSIAPIAPVCIGPTWKRHPNLWTPAKPIYVLPDHVGIATLGWEILAWIKLELRDPDVTDHAGNPGPWNPTAEQTRFILWWYAIDKDGRFLFRRGILQRLKGWGKDPLAAVLACVELVGPCRWAFWRLPDGTAADIWEPGAEPVAKENNSAWVQVAAVTEKQTINTMQLFRAMMSKELISRKRIDIGLTVIYVKGTSRRLDAVTSNPGALEGNRPSFVILNETQEWLANNSGHEMKNALEGNATKAKGGAARMLAICNAYRPGQESVAKSWRRAWELEESGVTIKTGVLYDSLEAPEDVRIIPKAIDAKTGEILEEYEIHEDQIRAYLDAVLSAVRGDATWLHVDSLVASVLDTSNPASESRRKWFNQVVAAEDAWLDPAWEKAARDEELDLSRKASFADRDPLRLGWARIERDEPCVMFGDGSKADDATGLVIVRLSDGYTTVGGVWQKPAGDPTKVWRAPRTDVDLRVDEIMARFNIVGFLFDPSHAREDENSTPYWNTTIDGWHRKYGERMQYWATRTGDRAHSIMWDMASPARQSEFVSAAMVTREEFKNGTIGRNDAHPRLVDHLGNAKANPDNKFGTTLMKEHRESPKKIDLAVCLVGAQMLRRFVLNKGLEEQDQPAEVWGAPVRR